MDENTQHPMPLARAWALQHAGSDWGLSRAQFDVIAIYI